MFFCYAQRGAFAVATPFLMKELGFNQAVMGVLLSAFFWSYSLAQMPAGMLIDRYGVGRVYGAGFLIWSAALALTGWPSTIAGFIAVRMMLGIGQGVAFPASARAVATWFPPSQRGGVTGVYLAGNRVGQAAITGIGPLAIAVWGWRAFFAAVGIAGVVWLVAWGPTMKWWDADRGPASARPSPAQSLELLRDRRVLGVALGFFAYDYVWFLFNSWTPAYLMLHRHFTAGEVGFYTSMPYVIVSFVIVPAGMLGDWLVRRGGNDVTVRKWIITVGMLVACLIVPAGLVESRVVSAWMLAFAIFGLGAAAPNCWALTQAVCPKPLVATASGIQNLGGNLGGVLAPAVTGFIAHATGSFVWAFTIAGAVLLGGIACYWLLIPPTSSA
jgi:MFS family permease